MIVLREYRALFDGIHIKFDSPRGTHTVHERSQVEAIEAALKQAYDAGGEKQC